MNRSIRNTVIILFSVVVLVFGFVIGHQVLLDRDAKSAPAPELSELNTYVFDQGKPLAEFQLLNDAGKTVTTASLKGRWTIAFIGYTQCPDVCPTILSMLRQVDPLLPAEVPHPDYLMISADPERDTPARLREYLNFFGSDFHGLTGDADALQALAKSLNGVFVHRDDGQGHDQIDHSAHLALINPDGQMIAIMQAPYTPETVAQAYQRIYLWARSNLARSG